MAADCENRHSLDEFGPYNTLPDAEKTLKTALDAIILQGGGILCIPLDAPAGFHPRNLVQEGVDKPGVTILDLRRGVERAFVPPVGAMSSEGTRGSRILERDLAQDLRWQDNFPTEAIVSRYRGGASSYFNKLARDAAKGTDRLYVPTHQGLFIGQTLLVTGKAYALPHDLIRVKELGIDSNGLYLVSREALKEDHPAEGFIYNKTSINGLTIRDTSNCDNQSATLAVDRTTYGIGDTFAIASRLVYQGNIMSGGGDEGGVGVASQIEHDLDCFWGEVESWDATNRKLVYKPVVGAPQKLGTSRPLINMNGSKHHKKGKILIVPPNHEVLGEPKGSGLVIGDKAVDWDASMVGRFLAIDVATERYAADEKNALQTSTGHVVHRWWRIAEMRKRGDGLWVLKVERTVTWTGHGGPTLFRWDNYTTDDANLKWHDYIIAPGAWVSDVRRGVAGDKPGNIGQAGAGDERTILLAPSTSTGTFDFAKDDPITNPPGPDVWIPTAFRARHFDSFPGMMQGISFLSENSSKVQLGAALMVNGTSLTLAAAAASQKDGAPMFAAGVDVVACTRNAFLLRGEVEQDAIRLCQLNDKPNRITWLCKRMTWGSSLHADPASGNFVFFGGDIDHQDRGSIHQSGLSATGTAARNLSGVKVPVPAGALEIVLPLRKEENADYGILVECSWLTLKAVKDKKDTSFKVLFGTAAPAGATLDWLLVR